MKSKKGKFNDSWVTINGLPIYARVSAAPEVQNNPAIVMVHGLVVSSRYMIPTAEHLAEHCRVYIPDLPGYGNSGKPKHILTISELADALAAWMEVTGLEKATLLGNSMGGQIIASFALRHSARLERAVLVGPTMDPQARTAHQQILRWLRNIPGEPLSLFPIVTLDYLQIGFRRFVHTFRYALRNRIEEHLPSMHVPTLVVGGARDTVVPSRWLQEVTQLLPNGQFTIIDGAAHDVNYNSPQQLTQAILKFIQTTPTSSPLRNARTAALNSSG